MASCRVIEDSAGSSEEKPQTHVASPCESHDGVHTRGSSNAGQACPVRGNGHSEPHDGLGFRAQCVAGISLLILFVLRVTWLVDGRRQVTGFRVVHLQGLEFRKFGGGGGAWDDVILIMARFRTQNPAVEPSKSHGLSKPSKLYGPYKHHNPREPCKSPMKAL